MRTRLKRVVCIMLLVSLITGCSTSNTEKTSNTDSKNSTTSLSVGSWKTAQTIQPFFYGDYINGDYDVEVLPFTNPGDQKTALLAGSLNMCGTTLVTAIMAAAKGEPIKIVSGLCNKCSALVVGKDSDIKSEADLKGKTIAYVPGTMHHILLLEVLRRNGIDPDKDVTLKRIDFFDMAKALAEGTIDAFCSGEPYPSQVIVQGYGRILSYPYFDDSIGTINAAMITTEDMIKNNPEIVQELVNAHVKATEALNSDKEKWFAKSEEFGTEANIMEASFDNIELFYDIDETFIQHTKKLAEKMCELKLINEVPDIDALFDTSFLENAKKES